MYLIQDAMDVKFAGLLTDGSVQQGINEMFTGKQYYNSQGPLSDGKISGSPFDTKPATAPASAAPVAGSRPPPARASAGAMPSSVPPSAPAAPAPATTEERRRLSVPSAPAPVMPGQGDSASRRLSTPASAAAAPPTGPVYMTAPPPPPPASPITRKVYVTTAVEKGELGIGLDLGKAKTGQGQVLRLKEFPPDVVNPASLCNPAILVGDVIVAVNGVACESLAESVKIIRAAVGSVQLTFERVVSL